MRDYCVLDPRTELEQYLTEDLKLAFEKIGFQVNHNGGVSHSPGGVPDIEMFDDEFHFNIEATQLTGTNADREYPSITDHLTKTSENSEKKCFCIYVSPETSIRMIDRIKEFNNLHRGEDDFKILPLSFENINILLSKFSENAADVFRFDNFIKVFDRFYDFDDDQRIKKVLFEEIFSSDKQLGERIKQEEIEKDQKTLELLINDLKKLENKFRERGIATGEKAIDTLIYLIFIKLYEEKREKKGESNRLKLKNFESYKSNLSQDIRENNKAIHELFKTIKSETEFSDSGMFNEYDNFTDELNDKIIIDEIIPIVEKYPSFIDTKIDALGAVYEVLALRAEKDVKIGQFFTPENVVNFMVQLADLDFEDIVLDPACGTGRFLIKSMQVMEEKLDSSTVRNKTEYLKNIKSKQLFGSDIDGRISKIAKMNMWVHGDGKTNIYKYNGLILNEKNSNLFSNSIDVILTNPPLGNLNYRENFTDEFIASNGVLPRKNKTLEKFKDQGKRLKNHVDEKEIMDNELASLADSTIIEKIKEFENKDNLSSSEKKQFKELKKSEEFKKYKSLKAKIKRKNKTISSNQEKLDELKVKINTNDCEFEITGNNLKGGALFLNSINNYLKTDRKPEELPEWRGGVLITVIDEGILNTEDYNRTRNFLTENFYIKAIISLSRDTFVPISNTSTKTSIIYAIKKEDKSLKQQEPIFYAYVDKVGMDTKGKICDNHLDSILDKYNKFKENILNSYEGKIFNKETFENKFQNRRLNDD